MLEGNAVQNYYEGACVYRGDGSLDYILHPEGVVRATGQGLSHEYFLKDHLGSTRVVFNGNGAVLQATDYYAFGMEHTPLAISNTNRYLYNGKELQDETFAGGVKLGWYDYGARFYDPQLGRFTTKDRFAEKYYYLTPYQYAGNNPISNIDFKGDSIIKVTIDDKSGYIKGESTLYIDHTIFDDTKAILEYAATNEVPIHLNSSFRTNKKQDGLTSANSTTPAAKSKSAHNAGLALDFNLYKNDKTSDGVDACNSTVTKGHKFIKEVKGKSWRWGGDFTDPDKIHMDKRGTDSNFETIRDANQTQMDGDNKENVDESLIKRTETITINKKDE